LSIGVCAESSAFVPRRVEVITFHDECQIDLEVVWPGDTRDRAMLDDPLSEPAVTWAIERFICEPQLEPKVIARRPCLNEILRIGWERCERIGHGLRGISSTFLKEFL
jgi:hypothetical protein